MSKIQAKYRTWFKGLPPQPIKMKLPGWGGDPAEHGDNARPQPWHCLPFVEGSTYGLELIYPFETECRVRTDDGYIIFEGSFKGEMKDSPFGKFAPGHYGFTSSLDILPPTDHVIRIEPHPSYFTDETWSTPLAVPGHIQSEWWPKIFFVVFRAPPPGQVHVFSKGKPFAQLLIVPKKVSYDLTRMSDEEAKERDELSNKYDLYEALISNIQWKDHKGNAFNDKYRVLSRAYAKGGMAAIHELLEAAEKKAAEDAASKKAPLKRRLIIKGLD